ncbi:hypothetical protein Tco_1191657 [Tanacetum coccineum]
MDLWLQIQVFYDRVSFHLKREIDHASDGKIRDNNVKESWEIIENLALYEHEGWNDSRDVVKPVKAISLPPNTSKTLDRRLRELKGPQTAPRTSPTHIPQHRSDDGKSSSFPNKYLKISGATARDAM